MMFPTVTHETTRPRYDGALSIASMGLLLSDHAGTHVDAWSHLTDEPGAATIDQMALGDFVATAVVVDVGDAGRPATGPAVRARVDAALDRADAEAVLFRTGAVAEAADDVAGYLEGFRGLGADLIEQLAGRGVRLVGTDARSIDPADAEHGADGLPAHRACLLARMVVCENLDLREAPAGEPFTFLALPLKLAGCTGSPVRAVALLDSERTT
jgi:arylformamidase